MLAAARQRFGGDRRHAGLERLPSRERPRGAHDRAAARRSRTRPTATPTRRRVAKPDAGSLVDVGGAPPSADGAVGKSILAPGRPAERQLERAARVAPELDQRPPAGRDGAAGGLLHAADPARAGPPRPGHRRHRRRLRGRQPVRAARSRAGLRVVGHLRRTGHHRHVRRASCASPTAGRRRSSRRTISTRASAGRWRFSRGRTRSRPTRRIPSPPETYTLTAQRTVHGIVHKRGTVGGKPVAFAKQRSTYFHEADSARGFSDLNRPSKVAERAGLPAGRVQDRLHLQLVLRRRPRHRLLQLGRQPAARRRA